jgi:hypothetical protein
MRVVQAAALTAAAMLLASIGSAQGIGAAAAREREKRNSAPAKHAKVYTDGDLGTSIAVPAPDLPAAASGTDDAAAGAGTPAAEGAGAETAASAEGATQEGAAASPDASTEQQAADEQAKAQRAWKKKLDQARQEEQVYKDVIDKLQLELNDTSGGFYSPGRASKIAFLEENKTKLAEVQARIATLEEEGRRNRY